VPAPRGAQLIRDDRIDTGLHATGGDARRICDPFGLTIAGAMRCSGTLE
jgi:hypothetical protein